MKVFEPIDTAEILARAALERFAVDGAGKGNHDAITVGGLLAFALRAIGFVLLADARERLVDLGLGHLAGEPVSLMVLKSASAIAGTISTAIV